MSVVKQLVVVASVVVVVVVVVLMEVVVSVLLLLVVVVMVVMDIIDCSVDAHHCSVDTTELFYASFLENTISHSGQVAGIIVSFTKTLI